MHTPISMILAVDEDNGLWKSNSLAWRIKADMSYFKEITTTTLDPTKQNAVIMWRRTWESIPPKFRPLPDRKNYILTRDTTFVWWDGSFSRLEDCLETLQKDTTIENIYIIWWAQIYNEAIQKDIADTIYLTQVFGSFDCDVFFVWVPDNYELETIGEKQEENGISFKFLVYQKHHNKKSLTSGKTLWETEAPSVANIWE